MRAAADALVASGLAAQGYQYVTIDDAWEGARDANGEITSSDIKYDWCSYTDVEPAAARSPLPALKKPYALMRGILDTLDRDMVFSLCQYGWGDVLEWGGDVGGNLRVTGDITDTWPSMTGIGFAQRQPIRARSLAPGRSRRGIRHVLDRRPAARRCLCQDRQGEVIGSLG